MFALLVTLGAIAYFQQKGVTVAAERIMPELSLTQMQIGWVQWAFVLGYTPTQIFAGRVGERFGARCTLTVAGLLAILATLAMPLAPALLTGGALFAGLVLSQLMLGIAQSPTFPVGAGMVRAWLPPRRWALANGIQSMGLQLGAAATPPVIVLIMQRFGWQRALIWTSLPALGVVLLWAWYARDTPGEHPSVRAAELDELPPPEPVELATQDPDEQATWRVLLGRDVLLLTLSYMSMNYVYYLLSNWSFLYLVQERHLGVRLSGWLAALPPLGAALGAGVGGAIADHLSLRLGPRWGYRLLPLISLPLVTLSLLLVVLGVDALVAISLMTLCYALIELNEGPFWAVTMRVGGRRTMTATALLNTGGALGGLIGIPLVAHWSGQHHWDAAFLFGAGCALASACAWLVIDAQRPASRVNAAGSP
jgi:MFS transporter, ACS family, glucarate transporter